MQKDLKQRLIDVGAEMMRRSGYASVDVTEVCRTAKVARAHFYRLIPGKQGLGLAVLARFTAERDALVADALRADLNLEEKLQRFFVLLYREQADAKRVHGSTPGSLFALFTDAVSDEVIRKSVEDALDHTRDRVEAVVRAAIDSGEVRIEDSRYAATAIVAFAEGALQLARTLDRPEIVLDLAPVTFTFLSEDSISREGLRPLAME